jgi:geranylgeranyl diphosphate synthase, type II
MSTPDALATRVGRKIAAALVEHAPSGPRADPSLTEVIGAVAAEPGKMLRGRLVLATIAAHDGDESAGMLLATAVEYFHLASLLLDDLPCMDDAETRRGKPCVHRTHGEATAILVALAFINRAYGLAGCVIGTKLPALRLSLQACLDANLGSAGLLGGQARDLRFGDGEKTPREVGRVALAKTAAMFGLSLVMPALLALPNAGEARALRALVVYWGLAYQAIDDLQDILSTSVVAGKTVGRDRALSRPNLAVALGVPATRKRIRCWLTLASRSIQRLTEERAAWSYLGEWQRFFVAAAASLAVSAEAAA